MACWIWSPAETTTWNGLKRYPIRERQIIEPRHPVFLGGVEFEAFPVAHSLIAPAVGYRVSKGNVSVFYVPDLVYIFTSAIRPSQGVALYIGDGASIMKPLVRCRGKSMIGHASVRDQLDWCGEEGVSRAVITHRGSQIVKADASAVAGKIAALARERGVQASVAHDGLKLMCRTA